MMDGGARVVRQSFIRVADVRWAAMAEGRLGVDFREHAILRGGFVDHSVD